MTLTTIKNDLLSRMLALLGNIPSAEVSHENAPFIPPVGLADSEFFAGYTFLWGENIKASVGANARYRQTGMFVVQLVGRAGAGDGLLLEKVDALLALRGTTTTNGVVVTTGTPGNLVIAKGWANQSVSFNFYGDTVT